KGCAKPMEGDGEIPPAKGETDAKAGPKKRRRPVPPPAPSRAQTQIGMATKSAGRTKSGGTESPAMAPATIKRRKRRQPWLSMAVSASQVMGDLRANHGPCGQIGRAGPGRQGGGLLMEPRLEVQTS